MSEQHEALALKYRPVRFSDVVGQQATAAVLYQMARRKKLPPGLLFHGARGCGKTSTARILSMALNCEAEPGPAAQWPCGQCPSCEAVVNGTSLDVIEIDAASNGGVEQIRKIKEDALYGTGGEWKVYLLDEAHSMSRDAFNSLLIILEKPPPHVLFVLLTTEVGQIIPTVRSRCIKFPFRPVSEKVILSRLTYICESEGIPAEPSLLASIAETAEGGMRDAIMQLDQVTSVGITSQAMWQELTGEDDFAPRILAAASEGDYARAYAALDAALHTSGDYDWITNQLVRCLRDMLVLSTGASIAATGKALTVREQLSAQIGPSRLLAAMKVLWELKTRVRTESRRAGLELAVAMVSERLCPPQQEYSAPAVNGHRLPPADISDIKAVFGA